MEYLFAVLGLFVFLLIDFGALNRATPATNLGQTLGLFFSKNILYIILCIIILFVIISTGGNLSFVPESFRLKPGEDNRGAAFMLGLGLQVILTYVRKYVSPIPVEEK